MVLCSELARDFTLDDECERDSVDDGADEGADDDDEEEEEEEEECSDVDDEDAMLFDA